MLMLRDGHWYRSRAVLDRVAGLTLLDAPHATPDGYAVMVLDSGGPSAQPRPGGAPEVVRRPPSLVVQAGHGHDLLHAARDEGGQPAIRRVEFPVESVPDLEPLVEYDHLPEARKDRSVYPVGYKLA